MVKQEVNTIPIYVGIDGGGTKCKLIMENAHGERIAQAKAGPANICLSVETAVTSIRQAMQEALQQAGFDEKPKALKLYVGFGLAGTEIPSACHHFLKLISHDFTDMRLKSDAYTACLGAHAGQDGAIVIVGTGTVGYKIIAGKERRMSGWGFPHSNEGSGGLIGLELIRQTFYAYDKRQKWTPLLDAVYQKFNYQIDQLVTFANYANATKYASLFPLFTDYLAKEDPSALSMIKEAALKIDDIISQLLQGDTQLPLCLFGGVSTFIEPYLSDVSQRRLVPRQFDATDGALMLIKKECCHD